MPSVAEFLSRASCIDVDHCLPSVAEFVDVSYLATLREVDLPSVYIGQSSITRQKLGNKLGKINYSSRPVERAFEARSVLNDLAEFVPSLCRVIAELLRTVQCINSARVFAGQKPYDLVLPSVAEFYRPPVRTGKKS